MWNRTIDSSLIGKRINLLAKVKIVKQTEPLEFRLCGTVMNTQFTDDLELVAWEPTAPYRIMRFGSQNTNLERQWFGIIPTNLFIANLTSYYAPGARGYQLAVKALGNNPYQ